MLIFSQYIMGCNDTSKVLVSYIMPYIFGKVRDILRAGCRLDSALKLCLNVTSTRSDQTTFNLHQYRNIDFNADSGSV